MSEAQASVYLLPATALKTAQRLLVQLQTQMSTVTTFITFWRIRLVLNTYFPVGQS